MNSITRDVIKGMIGACAFILPISIGEYTLYKKFEHTPNPVQEVLRWPFNDVWSRVDTLTQEYKQLTEIKTQPLQGRIRAIEGLEKVISASSSHRSGHCIKEDVHVFITLENGKEFAYTGDFFAREGDSVSVQVFSADDVAKVQSFVKRVERFRGEKLERYWMTTDYGDALKKTPHVVHSINNIAPTKLRRLDGIIEAYQILESR
jgi:hypothetical protein